MSTTHGSLVQNPKRNKGDSYQMEFLRYNSPGAAFESMSLDTRNEFEVTPGVAPVKMRCVSITFSNEINNADVDLQFVVNSAIVHSWNVRNARTGYRNANFDTPHFTMNAGDQLFVQIRDGGVNASHTAIVVNFQFENNFTVGEFIQPVLL